MHQNDILKLFGIGRQIVSTMLMLILVSSCSDGSSDDASKENTRKEDAKATKKEVSTKQKESSKPIKETTTQLLPVSGQCFLLKGKNSSLDTSSQYRAEIVPQNMTVNDKKDRFKALMLPAVNLVFNELVENYKKTKAIIRNQTKTANQVEYLAFLRKCYRSETNNDLLIALYPHPKSITLAQAAMESAWGTSRFFKEANNIFGVWSFDKSEPRIPAGNKRGKKTVWVKKYSSIADAIRSYYRVLARGYAYTEFRNESYKGTDPIELVKHLEKYSERGEAYSDELASMIRFNKFKQYDE